MSFGRSAIRALANSPLRFTRCKSALGCQFFCAALSIALVVYAWPRLAGWFRRSAAVFCILIAALGAALARFNIYEQLMFHPIANPQFEAANRAQLDPDDMVLALHVNDARRAYPIREIAYHHIVNDALDGVPVVATY